MPLSGVWLAFQVLKGVSLMVYSLTGLQLKQEEKKKGRKVEMLESFEKYEIKRLERERLEKDESLDGYLERLKNITGLKP